MRILMKYHPLFFLKLGKMSQHLSPAPAVIGLLRVNILLSSERYKGKLVLRF